jgi:hypothetical protein
MAMTHPHAEASYRVIPIPKNGTFGVEVVIPDTYPATVTEFATEAEAEVWIVRHKRQIEANSQPNVFRRRRGANGWGGDATNQADHHADKQQSGKYRLVQSAAARSAAQIEFGGPHSNDPERSDAQVITPINRCNYARTRRDRRTRPKAASDE